VKHTTHYRLTINNKDLIITLTKPLPEAPFYKNPEKYCQYEDTKINALIHENKYGYEAYFRNYADTLRYFNYLKQLLPYYSFNNVFED
jgi:hypothetical protein